MSIVNSTHEPRNGMIRAENSRWPLGWVSSSNTTPGERCSWRHDHALGAVDHEGAERRHDRQLAEIDFLLDGVLEPALAVDFLEHVEAQLGALSGAAYVMSRSMHSSTEYFGSPSA